MTRPTLSNLNPHEYNEILSYYAFIVNLDRYNGSCNTFDNSSAKKSKYNRRCKYKYF